MINDVKTYLRPHPTPTASAGPPAPTATTNLAGNAFTGQRKAGFGLLDYNARYYSPSLGRFISADALVPNPANSQAFNRYSYVKNNPVRLIDPTGHADECGTTDHSGGCGQLVDGRLVAQVERSKAQENLSMWGTILPEDGTLSIGWSDTFDFALEGTISIGIFHIDEKGNIAMGTSTWGFGGSNTIGATTGPNVMATNAADLSELQGFYVNGGGGGALGAGSATVDYVGGRGKKGRIDGLNVSVATGPKISFPTPPLGDIPAAVPPIFVHGNVNFTPDQAVFTSRVNDNGSRSNCISWFSQCSLSIFNEGK